MFVARLERDGRGNKVIPNAYFCSRRSLPEKGGEISRIESSPSNVSQGFQGICAYIKHAPSFSFPSALVETVPSLSISGPFPPVLIIVPIPNFNRIASNYPGLCRSRIITRENVRSISDPRNCRLDIFQSRILNPGAVVRRLAY